MQSSTIQETIFKVAKHAYEEVFRKGGKLSYRVPKQKLFPKGTTVVWNKCNLRGRMFTAWANKNNTTVTINCIPRALLFLGSSFAKSVLVHELTHIAQYSLDKTESKNPSIYNAYMKANHGSGIFYNHDSFVSFLYPKEVEAMIYAGIFLHCLGHEVSTPMEGLEEALDGNFFDCDEALKDFARENAIVNIIPNHPRLLALFSKDPAYTMAFHDLKHKAKALARASRLFIHLQNLVNDLDEKALKRAVNRFKKAYAKDHDPAVFVRLLKGRRKKQRVCHACARA